MLLLENMQTVHKYTNIQVAKMHWNNGYSFKGEAA